MKKLLFAVIICVFAAIVASCSKQTPRAVVEEAYNCYNKGDYKGFFDHVYFPEGDEDGRAVWVEAVEKVNKRNKIVFNNIEFVSEEVDEENGTAVESFDYVDAHGNEHHEKEHLLKENGKWYIKIGE